MIGISIYEKRAYYFAIAGGILLILVGIPLTAGDTLETQKCDYVISNYTTTIETDPATNITTEETEQTHQNVCEYENVSISWSLKEAISVLYMLIGLGIIITYFDYRREEE